MGLEEQENHHYIPLSEKKSKAPPLRKVSTDRFGGNKGNKKPKPQIEIPEYDFRESYQKFEVKKFFGDNKIKPPV